MATVLYVDDEEGIRRAVSSWLTRKGHVVHTAGDVASARTLLALESLDVAFVDLWLGGESGLELQDWVDEHRPEFASHMIFVTGDIAPCEATTRALHALGRPVITKPFELADLESLVRRMGDGG